MSNNNIKGMLTEYNLNSVNDDVCAYFKKDNIWNILDMQRYEPYHSAFLVWFFRQDIQTGSQVKKFLSLLVAKADKAIWSNGWNKTSDMSDFANAIFTGSYSIKSISIIPEQVINKISQIRYADRIEIFIRCTIVINDLKCENQEQSLEILSRIRSIVPRGKIIKLLSIILMLFP
ncbi:MAG: hypothetical protein LKE41_07855 [Prevotella sp.]|jgi:hypothetical protein|nr:hypothetical protein [Prevotella sp.]HCN53581.1 hypothetical protein [Prevotella sp.]